MHKFIVAILFISCFLYVNTMASCVVSNQGLFYNCNVMIDGHLPAHLYFEFQLCKYPAKVIVMLDADALSIHKKEEHDIESTFYIYGVGAFNIQQQSNGKINFDLTSDSPLGLSLSKQSVIPDCKYNPYFVWIHSQSIGVLVCIGVSCVFALILFICSCCCLYDKVIRGIATTGGFPRCGCTSQSNVDFVVRV